MVFLNPIIGLAHRFTSTVDVQYLDAQNQERAKNWMQFWPKVALKLSEIQMQFCVTQPRALA